MDFTWAADGAAHAGAARRRRERRLRAYLRYARMSVAMALAEATHHTAPRGQKTARARGGERRVVRRQGPDSSPPSRPTPLVEVRPQGRVQRHVVEDLGEFAPMVQILDAPVPQMVDYVADALRLLDRPMAEQVIEVPKISCSPCPSRSRVPEPQSAEQLVEVPTVLSPTRIALQIAEQIVGIPAPRGRVQQRRLLLLWNAFLSRLEQLVDFPSSGGLGSSLSTCLPGSANQGALRTFPRGKKVRRPQPSRVPGCPPVSPHGLGTLMRTWALRMSRRLSRTRTMSSCCRKKRMRAAGSCPLPVWGRPYSWHRSSRWSVWHLPPQTFSRRTRERRRRPG